MNYASAMPLAFGVLGQQASPVGALGSGMKLGDLIGNKKAAQLAKLGDLVPTVSPAPDPRPAAPGTMLAPQRGTLGEAVRSPALFGEDGNFNVPQDAPAGPVRLGDVVQNVDPSAWHTKPPKFFSKDGMGPIVLAGLADALQQWSSGGRIEGHGLQNLMDMQTAQDAKEFDREKWSREYEAKRLEKLAPRVEQVGNTLGMLDPAHPSYSPFFTAPQPFEQFAKARGYEPGSPEYSQAVEDYRLGAWSDPALANKRKLEGVRFNDRKTLQDERLDVTRRGQNIRSTDTRRGQDLTDARGRRGQDLTDKRVRDFHGKKVGGQAVSSNEPMMRLSNGHYAVVRGGRWVDASTGQPVQ